MFNAGESVMPRAQQSSSIEGSCTTPTSFIVGQDPKGQWLALETHGLAGGLFKTMRDAIRFATFETDHRPGSVELATAPLRPIF